MYKPSILIITQEQFGYHSDLYYFCKYLRDKYNITYICKDHEQAKLDLYGITIKYISKKGNKVKIFIRFIISVLQEINSGYHIYFIKYFIGCSLLKIFNYNKIFIFDVRSGFIFPKKIKRFFYDSFMQFESIFFQHISVISKSLATKLKFDKKAFILPVGADVISNANKSFEKINLLYVGSLGIRNIDQSLKGFSKFHHKYRDKAEISYTIIGGALNEKEKLKKIVIEKNIEKAVNIEGYISLDKLKPYFDSCNIGISYIPVVDYYNFQPPTKTFEYLLSGMPVIATATYGNRAVINKTNGIVTLDNEDSFYKGLVRFYQNRKNYDSQKIRTESLRYEWSKIFTDFNEVIESMLLP